MQVLRLYPTELKEPLKILGHLTKIIWAAEQKMLREGARLEKGDRYGQSYNCMYLRRQQTNLSKGGVEMEQQIQEILKDSTIRTRQLSRTQGKEGV